MKNTVLALSLFLLPLVFCPPALAQYISPYISPLTNQPNTQVMINKTILNPANNQFVDNLNIDQHTFLPEQDVIFRISVTNVIQSDLKNLVVVDHLPDVLNFVSASFGNFDQKSRTLSLNIDTLKVGKTKTFEIRTKVKGTGEISVNVFCQTNLSRVTVSNMVNEDTATFCVSKQVLGTTSTLPTTGPKETASMLTLSFLFLAIGLLMNRILILERR